MNTVKTPRVKKHRKSLSLKVKLDVLKRLDSGERQIDVCNSLCLAGSTVRTIMKNRDSILEAGKFAVSHQAKKLSRARPAIMIEMERLLTEFIEDNLRRGIPINSVAIQEKAINLYEELKRNFPEKFGKAETFNASKGWFDRFRKRSTFYEVTSHCETTNDHQREIEKFKRELLRIIERYGYNSQQVFNIDETGLFWKRLPNRTFLLKQDNEEDYITASRDRLTLLLGTNASGDFKLKPLVIYSQENPKVLQGFAKSKLPVIWKSNKEAWLTKSVFVDWYVEYFSPSVERYCGQNNLAYKALLILDTSNGHPDKEILEDLNENVKILYIPRNISRLLQPMNQGIFQRLKTRYVMKIVSDLSKIACTQKRDVCSIDFCESYNIKVAIDNISSSWEEITVSQVNRAWSNVWQACVKEENKREDESMETLKQEILTIAKEGGLHGIRANDLQELIDNHRDGLTNEELIARQMEIIETHVDEEINSPETEPIKSLTEKGLADAFEYFDKMCMYFRDNDPNMERSSRVIRDLERDLTCYRSLYNERKRTRNLEENTKSCYGKKCKGDVE